MSTVNSKVVTDAISHLWDLLDCRCWLRGRTRKLGLPLSVSNSWLFIGQGLANHSPFIPKVLSPLALGVSQDDSRMRRLRKRWRVRQRETGDKLESDPNTMLLQ